ncbi:MAG: oligosaccharide flippase family protein [Polaribacter sp.]
MSKKLLNNISYLSVFHIFNYALPFLLIPYLIKVLGEELYGVVILAQSLITYFLIITDFGFTLKSTKDISIHRKDKTKIREIVSSVFIIKFSLLIICFVVLLILIYLFPRFGQYFWVYLLTFLGVLGQILFPTWFFQGIEEMKYITLINVVTKTIFTLMIFFVVNDKSDYLYVPLFYSLGFMMSGLWALYVLLYTYKIKFIKISKKILISTFRESFYFFLSRLSSVGYSNTNTFMIGIMLPNSYITYYFLADKIISAVTKIFLPIQQALYPYLVNVFSKKIFKISTLFMFFCGILSSFAIYFLSDFLSVIFLKEEVKVFIFTLKILTIIIPISILYTSLGAPLLLAKGFMKEFNKSIIYGFILHLFLVGVLYFLSTSFKLIDGDILNYFCIFLILSKFSVFIIRIYYVQKKQLFKEIL